MHLFYVFIILFPLQLPSYLIIHLSIMGRILRLNLWTIVFENAIK